jgi:anti-anti-sigma factor
VAQRLREQVLAAPDRLDLENSEPFRQTAVALLDTLGRKAPGRLVVDLGATQTIDSAGLRALIMVRRHAASRETVVTLRAVSTELQSLLALAKMEDLFEIEDPAPT